MNPLFVFLGYNLENRHTFPLVFTCCVVVQELSRAFDFCFGVSFEILKSRFQEEMARGRTLTRRTRPKQSMTPARQDDTVGVYLLSAFNLLYSSSQELLEWPVLTTWLSACRAMYILDIFSIMSRQPLFLTHLCLCRTERNQTQQAPCLPISRLNDYVVFTGWVCAGSWHVPRRKSRQLSRAARQIACDGQTEGRVYLQRHTHATGSCVASISSRAPPNNRNR